MTTIWNALAVLCLLGTIVFSVLEVRAILGMVRRRQHGSTPANNPDLWRLIGYSTMAALTLIGFVVFGMMGTLLEGFL